MTRRRRILILTVVVGLVAVAAFGIYRLTRPSEGSWGTLLDRAETKNWTAIEPFTFSVVSDLHFGLDGDDRGSAMCRAAAAVEGALDARGEAYPRPDFAMTCGDNINNGPKADAAAELHKFHESLRVAGIPFYYANGNHDVEGDKIACREQRKEPWANGELHYAFEHRGVWFVVLNYYSDHGPNFPGAHLLVPQRRWLREKLVAIGRTQPIVVVMHPLPRRWDWLRMPDWIALDANEEAFLRDTLYGFNVQSILCGHYHGHHVETWNGIPVICVGSWVHGSPVVVAARVTSEEIRFEKFTSEDLLGDSRAKGRLLVRRPLRPQADER